MKDFNGKIAFITGGASGAGLGQAQVFAEAGAKVVIADIRQDHLDSAAAYFSDKDRSVHFIKLDVMDRSGYAAAADETERVFGAPPDLLIMTAGVNAYGPVEASTYEDYDWVVGVNFGGVVNGLVTFVPRMIKAGKGGHIAATASYGAFIAAPIVAPYAAAKAAVLSLLESYYISLKPYGIGVTILCPANINTNIYDSPIKTRPEHLKNTGYHANEDTQQYLSVAHKFGMEPRVLADWLKKGIENEQFLVLPYPSAERMLELELQRYIDYTTLEGVKRYEERMKQPQTEEQARLAIEKDGFNMRAPNAFPERKDVGFAKAKAELDWVAPEKRLSQ